MIKVSLRSIIKNGLLLLLFLTILLLKTSTIIIKIIINDIKESSNKIILRDGSGCISPIVCIILYILTVPIYSDNYYIKFDRANLNK